MEVLKMGKKKNIMEVLGEEEYSRVFDYCLEYGISPTDENMLSVARGDIPMSPMDDDSDDITAFLSERSGTKLVKDDDECYEIQPEKVKYTKETTVTMKPMDDIKCDKCNDLKDTSTLIRGITFERRKGLFDIFVINDDARTISIDLNALEYDEREFSENEALEYSQIVLREILPQLYPSAFLPVEGIDKRLVHVKDLDDGKFIFGEYRTLDYSERVILCYYISDASWEVFVDTVKYVTESGTLPEFIAALRHAPGFICGTFQDLYEDYVMSLMLCYNNSNNEFINLIIDDDETVIDDNTRNHSIFDMVSVIPVAYYDQRVTDILFPDPGITLKGEEDDDEDDDDDDYDDDYDDDEDDDEDEEDDDDDDEDEDESDNVEDVVVAEIVDKVDTVEPVDAVTVTVTETETVAVNSDSGVVTASEKTVVEISETTDEPEEVDAEDLLGEEFPDEGYSIGSRPAPKSNKKHNNSDNDSFIVKRR